MRLEWWSNSSVVPLRTASQAPAAAESRIDSASSARSSGHQISVRISVNERGTWRGGGMPGASEA